MTPGICSCFSSVQSYCCYCVSTKGLVFASRGWHSSCAMPSALRGIHFTYSVKYCIPFRENPVRRFTSVSRHVSPFSCIVGPSRCRFSVFVKFQWYCSAIGKLGPRVVQGPLYSAGSRGGSLLREKSFFYYYFSSPWRQKISIQYKNKRTKLDEIQLFPAGNRVNNLVLGKLFSLFTFLWNKVGSTLFGRLNLP